MLKSVAGQTEEMQSQALLVARDATSKHTVEKDVAQYIKKEFDSRFGATWHCIVGRNFGSFVTHGSCTELIASHGRGSLLANDWLTDGPETKHFIYFYLGNCAILLFKTQ